MGRYEEALEAFRSGDNERARKLSAEALALAETEGDRPGQVDARCMLARVALRQDDFTRVRELADEARACARSVGDRRLERMPLHMQAVAARMTGNLAEARELYEESIELNRSLGEERMVAAELHNLAYVELRDGAEDRARELFTRARLEAQRIGYDSLKPYLACPAGDLLAPRREPSHHARGMCQLRAASATVMGQVDRWWRREGAGSSTSSSGGLIRLRQGVEGLRRALAVLGR